MLFADVIGQESIKLHLKQELLRSRISHAQLFSGAPGVGKLALAIAFAQYVNCPNRIEEDSCGLCPSCVKFQSFAHPDLHFVFPIVKGGGKTDPVCDDYISQWRSMLEKRVYFELSDWYEHIGVANAQGMIYANESAEIIRKLNLKSYESAYKVMIIWLPEKMHQVAANKLLKILEEPPEKTLFLLITENASGILQTISSRTQLLQIPKIQDVDLHSYFTEKYNGEVSANVVPLAKGSLSAALKLLESKEEQQQYFENFKNLMRLCYSRKIPEMCEWVEEMSKIGRERQKQFLDNACRMLRENFLANFQETTLINLAPNEATFAQNFAPFINQHNIEYLFGEFSTAYHDIERNGNARIIFLDLGIKTMKGIRPK